jgi:hypothetical protein
MPDRTRDDLATELAEVEAQISEMVGAVDQSVDGFSTNETEALQVLRERRLELQTRINNGDAGGSPGDTARATAPTGSGW